jgi:hypothetical protein
VAAAADPVVPPVEDEVGASTPVWGWVAAGTGAAAIIVVVTILLISGGGDDGTTRIDGVDLDW